MRKAISKILMSSENIEVIDTAINGKQAVEKNIKLKPDVITMDIEMPVMNGLQALEAIMKSRPVPVLMLSTLTSDGANATIEALTNGAVGFITKKSAFNEMHSLKDEIIKEILNISTNSSIKNQINRRKLLNEQKYKTQKEPRTNSISKSKVSPTKTSNNELFKKNSISNRKRPNKLQVQIIAIGISTGGPAALLDVIPKLPENLPVPIIIAQHMPPHFTKSLADRLDSKSAIKVKEAEDGEHLHPGTVYVAQGGWHLKVNKRSKIEISSMPMDELYKPSVNVMLNSVCDVYRGKALGIIMTGMGHDGYEGIKQLRALGGYSIAQSLDSSIATGMPETIIERKEVDEIYDLNDISKAIISFFK
jgi:two-component system chemotaxis response regulator CheB